MCCLGVQRKGQPADPGLEQGAGLRQRGRTNVHQPDQDIQGGPGRFCSDLSVTPGGGGLPFMMSPTNLLAVGLIFLALLSLQVVSVSKKEKVKQRPQALNTVEMLRVASQALGMASSARAAATRRALLRPNKLPAH